MTRAGAVAAAAAAIIMRATSIIRENSRYLFRSTYERNKMRTKRCHHFNLWNFLSTLSFEVKLREPFPLIMMNSCENIGRRHISRQTASWDNNWNSWKKVQHTTNTIETVSEISFEQRNTSRWKWKLKADSIVECIFNQHHRFRNKQRETNKSILWRKNAVYVMKKWRAVNQSTCALIKSIEKK